MSQTVTLDSAEYKSEQVYTDQVTDALKFFIRLSLCYDVDAEGYVTDVTEGDTRITIADKEEKRHLILYQENITDHHAFIVNPFAEGLGTTPSAAWFYKLQNTSLSQRILFIVNQVLMIALNEKAKSKDAKAEKLHISMEFLNLVSLVIDDIDEKLIKEFEEISDVKNISNFINVFYNRKLMQAVFRCALFDEDSDWRAKFNIRKKSWGVFERLFLKLFNLENGAQFTKFTQKPISRAAAKLSSVLSTIFSVYSEINVVLDQIDEKQVIDLTTYRDHLSKLGAYTDIAKFMISSGTTSQPPVATTVPSNSAVPAPSNGVPGPFYARTPDPVQSPVPGMVAVPGPIRADGSASPVTYVPAGAPVFGSPGYGPAMPMINPHTGMPLYPTPGYGQPPPLLNYNPVPPPMMPFTGISNFNTTPNFGILAPNLPRQFF